MVEELQLHLERATHLLNQIRYAENLLDELFFAKPTVSVAPPPVDFFKNYTQQIFQAVEEAKADYEKIRFSKSPNTDQVSNVPTTMEGVIEYPDNFGELIGIRIREQRTVMNMTQSDLAIATGIRRPNIARLEKGQSLPNLATLLKVSKALRISLQSLLKF
ncbi:MAG: helix-turn-helix transcriptional regulator [Deltaproteobacteria bacterium]|nr:helix-turn-helix transcriptional regulator [Deltaproteobacteria bacterium]MBN2671790.1 helix-turn-helix transcriptional regulator [Deltaproteobacteria bacterium]